MNNEELLEVVPDAEVQEELAYAATLGEAGRAQILDKVGEHNASSPATSGGDVDAAWEDSVGDEAVGGSNPTPDQDVVEELGEALGYTYQDNEPLRTGEKLEDRDRDRWELHPESAEDFVDEVK